MRGQGFEDMSHEALIGRYWGGKLQNAFAGREIGSLGFGALTFDNGTSGGVRRRDWGQCGGHARYSRGAGWYGLRIKEVRWRWARPDKIVENKHAVSPKQGKSAIVGCKGGKNRGLTMSHIGCSIAVSNDAVLERAQILNGCKTPSWLPFNGGYPSLKTVQEGPAR